MSRGPLVNLQTRELLTHMLDTLAGELGGPGGEHVAQAREHARLALSAPDSAALLLELGRVQTALALATRQRPPSGATPRPVLTVQAAAPGLGGAVLTLEHAPPASLSRHEPLFLHLGGPYGWAWLDARTGTPQVQRYALPPYLITAAAELLGFDLEHVAACLTPPEVHP